MLPDITPTYTMAGPDCSETLYDGMVVKGRRPSGGTNPMKHSVVARENHKLIGPIINPLLTIRNSYTKQIPCTKV